MKILKITIIVLCTLCALNMHAQFHLLNNFETDFSLPIEIDTTQPGNLWQVGAPDKTNFNFAFSDPNVIVTDTALTYPTNNISSFETHFYLTAYAPEVVFEWAQKKDMDSLDGGWIEVSYDSGATWMNIYDDSLYYPYVYFPPVLLSNGEKGITGSTNQWLVKQIRWFFGWSQSTSRVDLRFNFFSDDIETNQDGWMLDNFRATEIDIPIGMSERSKVVDLDLFPNPASKHLRLSLETILPVRLKFELRDMSGHLVHTFPIITAMPGRKVSYFELPELPAGVYLLSEPTIAVSRILMVE